MSDSAEQIFAGLIADRGGLQRFDETQRQICRRVSLLLSDDSSDFNASALNVLLSLLPEKSAGPEYDLTKLTDKQFEQLDYLTAVAAGLKPAKPQKPRRHPLRSWKQLYVEETTLLLDQIEGESLHRQRKGEPVKLSDDDVLHVRSALEWLLTGLPTTPEQVFAYIAENAQFEVRKEFRVREEGALAAVAAAPDAAPVAGAVVVDNVIKPSVRTWGGEALRGGLERGVW